jgi:predicted ATPase
MLESLHLKNVGPAPEMEMQLAPRLNLITGDNGLGKSFLLDVAWWALTRKWPAEVNPGVGSGLMARPTREGLATIDFAVQDAAESKRFHGEFNRREETWIVERGLAVNPGLVLYAQVDGSFAVWDPARNYSKENGVGASGSRQPAYVFSARDVWNGLEAGSTRVCNGLIADWALWQKEGGETFQQLKSVLVAMSPSSSEPIEPGELGKLAVDDSRWIPTLKTRYGNDVLILMASAAVRRIASLGYLLVWSWQEHVRAAKLLTEVPTSQITFLIDEVECHLHPRWQRTIVRSLLEVMQALTRSTAVQVIAATHSPLLLASVEPIFCGCTDAWFDLDLGPDSSAVKLERRPFVRHGDVSNWLTSNAFDLKCARSIEAETAIEKARALLREAYPTAEQARAIDAELRCAALPDIDPFWIRWGKFMESFGEEL